MSTPRSKIRMTEKTRSRIPTSVASAPDRAFVINNVLLYNHKQFPVPKHDSKELRCHESIVYIIQIVK
jgi:hypothetical protein